MDTARSWTNEHRETIARIVRRLVEIQEARSLSDRQLVTEYPQLGSAKTWRQRLVNGDFGDLNPQRTLRRLAQIETVLDGGTPDAIFYRDLPFAQELIARIGALERSTTDRRIGVFLAPNGCGKTSVARWAVAQARSTRAYCRIRIGWRNKVLHIANGLCAALGADSVSRNAPEAEDRLIALLTGTPRLVFLDQAHEGGVALMHLLRELVDETPSRFVYLGYDTAFRQVQNATTDALVEAQAFIGRCQKPIYNAYKGGTTARDVSVYLQRSADLSASVAGSVADKIASVLAQTTNLRLLDDAITQARILADADEAKPAAIVDQVLALAGREKIATRTGEDAE